MSTSAIGFDGSRDGRASLVRATREDDGTIRFEPLATAPEPDDPEAFVRHYLNEWTHVGWTDAPADVEFTPAPADAEPVIDVALWERARSVTFSDFDARPLLERIGTLLDDVVDAELSPDAARWSPDDGVTW